MKDGYEATTPFQPVDLPPIAPEPDEPKDEDVAVEEDADQDAPVAPDIETPPT